MGNERDCYPNKKLLVEPEYLGHLQSHSNDVLALGWQTESPDSVSAPNMGNDDLIPRRSSKTKLDCEFIIPCSSPP